MTDNKILILYGDLRQQALYNYLKKRKFNVEISSNLGTLSSILDNACNFNIIACPIPFTKNNETIFDVSKSTEAMSISKFLDFIKPGQLIFGGNIPSYVQIQCKEKNAVVTDLLKDDNFLYMNSYLTAEALIGKIILTIPASLCDMKVLITGYGMCGKAIAKLISPFGCNIFIYNRSNKSILCQFTRYSFDIASSPFGISKNASKTNSRFGNSKDFLDLATSITGKAPIITIPDAEPIGPKSMLDILVIAPCTGNTLSTNDALGMNLKNIGILLNTKNIYFVPFGQENAHIHMRML